MCLPERDTALDELLGDVGGEQERVGDGLGEAVAVRLEAADEDGHPLEPEADVAAGVEDRRLVLLQVAVVRERQALDRREQPGEAPDRRSRLAAHELGDVRVELLRHHRRSGRRVLGQLHETELGRRPEHDLLAHSRQVAEEHRGRVEVVEREVAVRDGVDRVAHLAVGRVDPERRARDRAGAERARRRRLARRVESRAVALEHLDPGEEVVAEGHGLAALEVRVPGHQRLGLGLGERQRDERERVDLLARLVACVDHVAPEGGRDLVVARASGVDLPADVAEQPLDRRMDVLVLVEDPGRVVRDGGEPLLDLVQLVGREEPRAVEAPGVLCGRGAVVRQELRVVRAQELPHGGVERPAHASRPERHAAILADPTAVRVGRVPGSGGRPVGWNHEGPPGGRPLVSNISPEAAYIIVRPCPACPRRPAAPSRAPRRRSPRW